MILRTRFGNVEYRSEFGNASDIRPPWSAWISSAGLPVTPVQAFGLPAVSNVIRSAAEITASLPFMVYRDGDVRERVPNAWQYGLLHDRPSEQCDSFEFFYDLALSLEATQNAFIQKAKFRRRVFELYLLDPQRVTVRQDRETGEKLFDVYVGNGAVRRDLTADEILHVRGFSLQPGSVAGVSLMQIHRDPIGAGIAMQKFEGDYFRNSGNSPFVFEIQGGSEAQAQALLNAYNQQHQGPGKQWRPTAVWGGTTVKPMPLSMQDAAFAEAKRLSIEDACRIWRWPREWVGLPDDREQGDLNATLAQNMKLYLLPRLRRIERAFAADPDLFWESGLIGEFLTEGLERADVVTRYRAYKDARQGSWITANEIRRFENLPPKEGGDEIQQTPVGGAPNPTDTETDDVVSEDERHAQNGHEEGVLLSR